MGYENLDAIEETVKRYKIDCDFQRTGEMVVATEPYQVEEMRDEPEQFAKYGLQSGMVGPRTGQGNCQFANLSGRAV